MAVPEVCALQDPLAEAGEVAIGERRSCSIADPVIAARASGIAMVVIVRGMRENCTHLEASDAS